jgi:CelD/BcsL family acetyltransferase involved in cellulose biosynthesis
MKQFERVEDWVTRPRLVFRKFRITVLTKDCAGRPLVDNPRLLLESVGPSVRALRVLGQPVEINQARISFRKGCIRYVVSSDMRSYVDLEGTFPTYLKKLSAKTRAETGRNVRRFLKVNGDFPSYREFRRPEDIIEFHQLACQVSGQTYQSQLLGIGIDPSSNFRAELSRAASADAFRGYILFYRGTPVAFNYALATDDILIGTKMGYDPDFAQHCPGTVLFFLMLERLFSGDRFRRLDLDSGSWDYKARYATGAYQAADVYYLRLNVTDLTLVCIHATVRALFNALLKPFRIVLNQLGIKGQRKRALQALFKRVFRRNVGF